MEDDRSETPASTTESTHDVLAFVTELLLSDNAHNLVRAANRVGEMLAENHPDLPKLVEVFDKACQVAHLPLASGILVALSATVRSFLVTRAIAIPDSPVDNPGECSLCHANVTERCNDGVCRACHSVESIEACLAGTQINAIRAAVGLPYPAFLQGHRFKPRGG